MKTIEEIEAQMVELQKELELLKNPPSYKRWRAEVGGHYYIKGSNFSTIIDNYDRGDDFSYNIGDYYKTKEEADEAYNMQTTIVRVNDKINELNEGWKHNNELERYYIFFKRNNYLTDCFGLSSEGYISPRIINFCKTEKIAEKIIAENKDDLDLIFNLK